MYGCDPWKDKEDAIERRLDVVESKTLDHDRDLIDLNGTVDANRTHAEALISTRASRGAFSDIEVAANASTVIIATEREDGGIVLRSMPVVTSDNAGVAPPSLFSEVAVLRSEVDGIKGTVVWYPNTQNTLTTGMTSTQVVTSFAAAYPGVVPGDGAIYQNTDGSAGYRYSHLLESWVGFFDGASIGQFTNATLGMIKGSAVEGQIFAETDGTGAVVGWDDLVTDVGELTVNKEDAANKVNAWSATPGNSKYPSEKLTKDSLDGKVASNLAITPGTKTKITYDAKGLVTSGASLAASDIPSLNAGKITSGIFAIGRIPSLSISKTVGLQTVLDAKIPSSDKGVAEGVATLDVSGKVPSSQIPAVSVALQTFTNSALGGIKGSATAGRISANADGTGSVNGWDGKFDKSGGIVSGVLNIDYGDYNDFRLGSALETAKNMIFMSWEKLSKRLYTEIQYHDEDGVYRRFYPFTLCHDGINQSWGTITTRATPGSSDVVSYSQLLSAQSDIMSSVANTYARADAVRDVNGITGLDAKGKIPIAQLPSELSTPIYQHNISYEWEQSPTKHKCYFTLYNTISSPMTANEILAYFDDLGSVHPATGYIVASSNYNIYGIAGIGNYNELVIACVKTDFSQGNVQTSGFANKFTDTVTQVV